MTKLNTIIGLLFIPFMVFADTPPPGTVKAKLQDGAGTPITSTLITGKQGIDVNVISSSGGGTSTVDQGVQGSSSSPWWVNVTNASIPVTGTFFQSVQPVSQSGVWSVGATISNFPATQAVTQSGTWTVQQGTPPWAISAASLPLPSGASTSALQTSGNASLTSIDSKLTSPLTVTGPLTDTQLRASPVPVSGTVTASISGVSTASNQTDGTQLTQLVDMTTAPAGPWVNLNGFNYIPTYGLSDEVSGFGPLGFVSVVGGINSSNLIQEFTLDGSGNLNTAVNNFPATFSVTQGGPFNVEVNQSTAGNLLSTVFQSSGANLHVNVDSAPTTTVIQPTGTNLHAILDSGSVTTVVQGTGGNLHVNVDSAPTTTVTGTVTSNAGTNLNTSLLATSANQTNATQKSQQVDGAGSVVGPNVTISGTNYSPVVLAASATPGAAVVSRSIQIAGSDGTNAQTIKVKTTGAVVVDRIGTSTGQLIRNDYSSVNVTTSAYTTLIASTTNETNHIYVFDSSGQTLFLATGAAASEVNKYYIVPGGNGLIDLNISAGTRISVKAVSASATAGELSLTLLQ